MIVINLLTATICFAGSCYPALVGVTTPVGEFQVQHIMTDQKGYGGDILPFKETANTRFAIHRVYLLNPKQRRMERLTSGKVTDRTITNGCVNVMPDVYEKLVDCCSNDQLTITK